MLLWLPQPLEALKRFQSRAKDNDNGIGSLAESALFFKDTCPTAFHPVAVIFFQSDAAQWRSDGLTPPRRQVEFEHPENTVVSASCSPAD